MENTNAKWAMDGRGKGMLLGLVAVAGFALTLPATRMAVRYADPLFVGLGRISIAGVVAALLLFLFRQPIPGRRQLLHLAAVAAGVVVGFPLLSSLAMHRIEAVHGSVVLGILPLFTAAAGAILFGERPSGAFWAVSLLGSGIVLWFVMPQGGQGFSSGDAALLGAVIAASIGYAVGGNLAKELGGWQVICWALVITLPIALPLTLGIAPRNVAALPAPGWGALFYLSLVSQLLAFFAWNKGMAIGGIARVSQVQLLQPFMTIIASGLFLGEVVKPGSVLFAAMIVATVLIGKRAAVKPGFSR